MRDYIVRLNDANITPEMVDRYVEILANMKSNAMFLVHKDLDIEWIPICLDCSIRDWLRQRVYYFGW